MIVSDNVPLWNKDAAALLKQFLETPTGHIFLQRLAYERPPFSPGTELNSVALQAKYVAGYERAVQRIMVLSEPPIDLNAPVEEQYPDLDNESLWPSPGKDERYMPPTPKPRERPPVPPVNPASTEPPKPKKA